MWPVGYEERLQSWVQLREDCKNKPIAEQLNQIAGWWGHAPRVRNVVHWHDQENWPSPWELLADNSYDELAIALGMSYTTLMLDSINTTVELAQAKDSTAGDFYIVLVDDRKYILNYDPWLAVNSEQTDFTILNTVEQDQLLKKIG